ncbi:hypothetical protein [Roseiflexus castenholzii]|uniref:hypothetical protein n=1 Tax=Roseiflexus castenholzii TaxID=120962 RepID=UPI003C7A55B1
MTHLRDYGWEDRDIQAFLQDYSEYGAGLSFVVGEHPLLWDAWARRDDCRSYLLILRALRAPDTPMSSVERWVTGALSSEKASDEDCQTIAATVQEIPGLAAEAVAAIMTDAHDWERWANRTLPPERAAAIETVMRVGAGDPMIAQRVLRRIVATGGWPTAQAAAPDAIHALIDATILSSSALLSVIRDGIITGKMIAALAHHPDIAESALQSVGKCWDRLSDQDQKIAVRTAMQQTSWALALVRTRGHDSSLMQAALGKSPSDDAIVAYVGAVAESRPTPAQIETLVVELPRLTPSVGTLFGGTARFWFETLKTRHPGRALSAIQSSEEGGFDRWKEFASVLVKIISADASTAAESLRFVGPDPQLLDAISADPSVWPGAIHALDGWARRSGDAEASDRARAVRATFIDRAMNDSSVTEPHRSAVLLAASHYDALPDDAIALIMNAADDPPARALALILNLRPSWDRIAELTRNRLVETAMMSLETIPSLIEAVGAHPTLIAAMKRFAEERKNSTEWMTGYAHIVKALVDSGAWRTIDRNQRELLLRPLLDSGSGIAAALFCAPNDPLTLAAIRAWPRKIAAPTTVWAQRLVESRPDAVTDELRQAIAEVTPPVKPLLVATARVLGGLRALGERIGRFGNVYVQAAAESQFFDDALDREPPTHIELDIRQRQVEVHGVRLLTMLEQEGYDPDVQIGFASGHPVLAAEYLIRHPDCLHDPLALSVLRLSVNAPPVIDIDALEEEDAARWERMIGVTAQGIIGAMRVGGCPDFLIGALPARMIIEAERNGLTCSPLTRAIWNARLAEDSETLLEYAQLVGPRPWIETTLRVQHPNLLERYRKVVADYRQRQGETTTDAPGDDRPDDDRPAERLRKILRGLS